MDIRKLQRAIVDGLEDVKAHDIVVFNTEHLSPLFERVIVASGTSNRQTRALASSVRETVKARGLPVIGMEGVDNGEWIVVDCGAAVAHIMQPAIRDYYRLEEIWGGKPVRMKIDSELRPVAAAAAGDAGMPASRARATSRGAAASKPIDGGQRAVRRPPGSATKAAAKKTRPIKKARPAKKAPPRRGGAKRAPRPR